VRFSTDGRKRQQWECRFELLDGTTGKHRYRERIPRLLREDPICPECGLPIHDPWRGKRIFKNYYVLVEPVADALVKLAGGLGYRLATQGSGQSSKRYETGCLCLPRTRPDQASVPRETAGDLREAPHRYARARHGH
jgi:hypothetical protein